VALTTRIAASGDENAVFSVRTLWFLLLRLTMRSYGLGTHVFLWHARSAPFCISNDVFFVLLCFVLFFFMDVLLQYLVKYFNFYQLAGGCLQRAVGGVEFEI